MKTFIHRTQLRATVREVAAFHSSTQALKRLTPPPIIAQIHSMEPLGEGSVSKFTLWMGPIPVRWTARHSHVDPLHGFTDEQIHGPFQRWVHRHTFRELDHGGCEVVDMVQASFGKGGVSALVSRLMWFGLPLMFAYRAWVLRRALAGSVYSLRSAE